MLVATVCGLVRRLILARLQLVHRGNIGSNTTGTLLVPYCVGRLLGVYSPEKIAHMGDHLGEVRFEQPMAAVKQV
jgi:hypothetical protein